MITMLVIITFLLALAILVLAKAYFTILDLESEVDFLKFREENLREMYENLKNRQK